MFPCPHCQKPIEVGPYAGVPFWKQNLTPGLGCGSLLAIGVIVALCSGGLDRSDLRELRGDLQRLEKKLDTLDASLKQAPPLEKAAAQVP